MIGGEELAIQDKSEVPIVPSASRYSPSRQYETSSGPHTAPVKQQVQQGHVDGLSKQPNWVEFDKKVLRFYAYETIHMPENQEESVRVRKYIIFSSFSILFMLAFCLRTSRFNVYFYLEDDSIHISEPRTTNSGTPQGTFIRRHVIPAHDKPDAHLTVDDLNVGKQLVIYARVFQLTGCDEFTRHYLTSIGKTVPEDQPQPVGQYEIKRKELADR